MSASPESLHQRRLADRRHARKLAALGRAAGEISHDFNNLLTIIIGNLELLLGRDDAGPGARELLAEALEAALRGADLTQRLLTHARRDGPARQRTDINAAITALSARLTRLLGPAIRLELAPSVGLPLAVIDRVDLESAILNLVTNARDAMPDGGTLRIATESPPGAQTLTIIVQDSGTSMSPEVAARAFEPFFTTKPRGRGTGLGLPMVRAFAEHAGGSATLHAAPGGGTIVLMSLPAPPLPPGGETC